MPNRKPKSLRRPSAEAMRSIRALLQSSLADINTGDPDSTYMALTDTERTAIGGISRFREIYQWLKG